MRLPTTHEQTGIDIMDASPENQPSREDIQYQEALLPMADLPPRSPHHFYLPQGLLQSWTAVLILLPPFCHGHGYRRACEWLLRGLVRP